MKDNNIIKLRTIFLMNGMKNKPFAEKCGVIYARAEQASYQQQRQRHREQQKQENQGPSNKTAATAPGQTYSIDCTACKLAAGMEKRTIARFPFFIRIIGMIIATPSALGMLFGAILILKPGPGFGLDSPSLFWPGFFIITISATGGLVGWLLLMRKKAWVCGRCGFMLDRA